MWRRRLHPLDEELLLAKEGEPSPRKAARVRAHVADCPACLQRMEEIEGTAVALTEAYRKDMEPQLEHFVGARSALADKLGALPNTSRHSHKTANPNGLFNKWTWAYACAAVIVAVLAIYTMHRRDDEAMNSSPVLPLTTLTPGSTRPIAVSEVCTPGPLDQMATIPLSTRKEVLREYGIDDARVGMFEVDHLITPELGGTDDIRNLWPEPYSSTAWNAYVKDQLEDHLRQLVCDGKLDLTTAQHDIATDWISAYKKYFRTEKPLPRYSSTDVRDNRVPKT